MVCSSVSTLTVWSVVDFDAVSRTGVRLRIANLQNMPSKFILMLSKFGTGQLARVKWRRGSQVGAELVSAGHSGHMNPDNDAAESAKAGRR